MANEITTAAVDAIATVTVTKDEYDRMLAAWKLVEFLNDPRTEVELVTTRDIDWKVEHVTCTYTDPFTLQPGREYGATPSEAMENALYVIRTLRRTRDAKAAAVAA